MVTRISEEEEHRGRGGERGDGDHNQQTTKQRGGGSRGK